MTIVTNLPEIAITATAALAHQVDIAVGNILGGIAIQTAVLALLDAAGVRPRRPLTHLAALLTLTLECAVVVALLVVVMSTQLPESVIVARLTPGGVFIAPFWIVGLLLVRRARRGLPWPGGGVAPVAPRQVAAKRRWQPGGAGWRGWASAGQP